MAALVKIQPFGHSFVSRLRCFIRDEKKLRYDLGLESKPLIQYSGYPGATVASLKAKFEAVEYFAPDALFVLIGTNDIYKKDVTSNELVNHICNLVDYAFNFLNIRKVVVFQVLHRCLPTKSTRFPVDIGWYNGLVVELNTELGDTFKSRFPNQAYVWRLKGLWSPATKLKNFSDDGCHLSRDGQFKLLSNIRAAAVAAIRSTIK